jgi:hypothetical protein
LRSRPALLTSPCSQIATSQKSRWTSIPINLIAAPLALLFALYDHFIPSGFEVDQLNAAVEGEMDASAR